jgi:trimeric autotransporter adhesin
MTDTLVIFDPTQPVGARFKSTAVSEEIGAVAPSNLLPGAITQSMLADGAVSTPALAAGCVTSAALATDCVTAAALAPNSVTSSALAPNSITASALAPGVPNATDNAGNPISLTLVILNAAQYAAIGSPSVTSLYFITD